MIYGILAIFLTSKYVVSLVILWMVYKVLEWWHNPLRRIPGPQRSLIVGFFVDMYWKLKNRMQRYDGMSKYKEIPSPPAYPLLKHLPHLWRDTNLTQQLLKWSKMFANEGIFRYDPLLGGSRVCVFKERFIKQILHTNFYKYGNAGVAASFFPSTAGGLFDANGKEHAWQRKMLNPAFSYSSIIDFLNIFEENATILVQILKERTGPSMTRTAEVDVAKHFSHYTLDVIGEAGFGYKFNTVLCGDSPASQALQRIMTGRARLKTRVLKRMIPFIENLPLKANIETKKALKLTQSLVDEVIQSRREKLKEEKDEVQDIGNDFLAKMMPLQDKETNRTMTDELLHSEVYTFFFASTDSTTVALTWLFYLLAKHPSIQERAREECRAVIGKKAVTAQGLASLKFTTATIKESLRMYAPASVILKKALKEDVLGEYVIQKGQFVIIPVSVLHDLDTNWLDPCKFIPDRFLDDDEGKSEITTYKFMPFSTGARSCIGQKFAMAEMKVVTAKLLCNFKFEIDPGHPRVSGTQRFTLKPEPTPILRITQLDD